MTRKIDGAAAQQALLPGATQSSTDAGLKAWALCELYGHQRIVGHITVDPVEFPGMIRIDVPDLMKGGEVARKGHTRFYTSAATRSTRSRRSTNKPSETFCLTSTDCRHVRRASGMAGDGN